jgi:hypothetical protein
MPPKGMQVSWELIGTALVILGWLCSSIWLVSSMSTDIRSLKETVVKVEARYGDLEDQVYWLQWVAAGNVGPIQPKHLGGKP